MLVTDYIIGLYQLNYLVKEGRPICIKIRKLCLFFADLLGFDKNLDCMFILFTISIFAKTVVYSVDLITVGLLLLALFTILYFRFKYLDNVSD